MEHAIDIIRVLKIFEIIRENGKKIDDEYYYEGFFASSSYDGYTVMLRTQQVKMFIGFHNTFHFDSKHQADIDDFMHSLLNLEFLNQDKSS
ncbi:DUF3081 domain-containing protein [Endozoicomonas sp. OPT23]|uniref:DUF3081 family protein n=1 Tax=Endozoicomonas sp. OPT23 TaxID=2072845 RepID=UPI00129AA6B9|nr:DUF3081 family protein [Endozoicomonas sp. OPT23]MRI33433.1 DUF3081 domain-containing protein [Endozoicomonas sp. OPT23]